MALRILFQDHPRSIALSTDSHVLIFLHQPSQVSAAPAAPHQCIAEFSSLSAVNLVSYRPLRSQRVLGTLGLINIEKDVFICVITNATPVASIRPGENVQRIVSVEFYCLSSDLFDQGFSEDLSLYNPFDQPSAFNGPKDFDGLDYKEESPQHPCQALKTALEDGTFYYSTDFDLTNRLQNRTLEHSSFDNGDTLDHSFLWNGYMIAPLVQFRSRLTITDRKALDASHVLTSAIRGYACSMTIPAVASPISNIETRLPSALTLISRLSCRRAGTRFNSRGLDDDGNVANFVETETIYYFPDGTSFSYSQVRGSVPLFWEQASGLLPQQQKIQLTRSAEATQPAFNKHFEDLELRYGTIHVLNLLSRSKAGESELSSRYIQHIQKTSINQTSSGAQASDHAMLKATHYDFHAETKGSGYEAASIIRHMISEQAEGFAFFLCKAVRHHPDVAASNKVILQQEGIFRTNCLDCLDRTNLVQGIISQMSMQMFFSQQNATPTKDFWSKHSTLWADNGDSLSRIYAGTGALKSSFTRHGKMSLAGALADARKSATRLYMNNFADKARQTLVDTLLGRLVGQSPVLLYDPINDYVQLELENRATEYTSSMDVNIWVGTFNLNGRRHGLECDLSPWIWGGKQKLRPHPHIVAVGFQEMVELNPEQILSTDPARRQEWENAVLHTLNAKGPSGSPQNYILLRSGQLVGAALMLFVRSSHLNYIKNVEGTLKKTGMSGMAGNKGAVAIRFELANTKMCFLTWPVACHQVGRSDDLQRADSRFSVTAHLAAGFANYDERNQDYRTISRGLRFQHGRSIEDHETIIWLGDFNYRIGLSNERVRQFIEVGDLGNLFKNDQMVAGHVFSYYNESRITFLPTYKYNNGTDEYDTSEKARIPAWCDRILWKAQNLKQIDYNTAPLRFSDHRPVFGTFFCLVHHNDEIVKQKLSEEIYRKRREHIQRNGNSGTRSMVGDEGGGKSFRQAATSQSLDNADPRKWWLRGGVPARSRVSETHSDSIPNPYRPSNPFTSSEKGDWIPRPFEGYKSFPGTTSPREMTIPVLRKPAPPIPEKPPSLLSFSRSEYKHIGTPTHPNTTEKPPGSGEKTQSQPKRNIVNTGFPPPPRRTTQNINADLLDAHRTQPPLPSREKREVPNIVDQDDEESKNISLRPLQPQ